MQHITSTMTAHLRKGSFQLVKPKRPKAPLGFCRWCGSKLTGKNASRRNYCYMKREGRNCRVEANHAWAFSTRDALRRMAKFQGKKELHCASCKQPVETIGAWGRKGTLIYPWDADHRKPLWEGGTHTLGNLQVLCILCHRRKTMAETKRRRRKKGP